MNSTVTGIEPFSSDRCTYCESMTLTERTGGILNHSLYLALGVTRCYRTPLTKVLQVFEGELTGQAELTIEHRSHMSGVEEETVTRFPTGVLRIVLKELREEYIDEVCATHCAARVTTLGFLYCCCSQDTNVIRCTIHKLCLVHNIWILKINFAL